MSVIRRKVRIVYDEERTPEGHVRCPNCHGTGRYRFRWSEPSFHNNPSVSDYRNCSRCMGMGYIPITELREGEKAE
jgi:DnaJ-class molecular chaperone